MTFSITDWIDINVRIESLSGQHYVGKITAVDPNCNLFLFTGENSNQFIIPFSSVKHIQPLPKQ
jgi:small nuclear ribonucleoprotein (snRNP)-like protein